MKKIHLGLDEFAAKVLSSGSPDKCRRQIAPRERPRGGMTNEGTAWNIANAFSAFQGHLQRLCFGKGR